MTEAVALAGLLATFAGLQATMWWRLSHRIGVNTDRLRMRIDDTRDRYVRRDDLDQHMTRIEAGQQQIIAAVARIDQRIDGLMAGRASQGD